MEWNERILTTPDEARLILRAALEAEPLLCDTGVDIYEAERRKRRRTYSEEELVRERAELQSEERLEAVAACADFVRAMAGSSRYYRDSTSYGFKHVVEERFKVVGEYLYVSNGSFIAAAVGLGFPLRREEWTPNAFFQFSSASVRSLTYRVPDRYCRAAYKALVARDPIITRRDRAVRDEASRLMIADLEPRYREKLARQADARQAYVPYARGPLDPPEPWPG